MFENYGSGGGNGSWCDGIKGRDRGNGGGCWRLGVGVEELRNRIFYKRER